MKNLNILNMGQKNLFSIPVSILCFRLVPLSLPWLMALWGFILLHFLKFFFYLYGCSVFWLKKIILMRNLIKKIHFFELLRYFKNRRLEISQTRFGIVLLTFPTVHLIKLELQVVSDGWNKPWTQMHLFLQILKSEYISVFL